LQQAAELLDAYGIDCVPTVHAATPADAVDAARKLGYPVALKSADPSLVHKSDVGAVQLDLRSDAAVRRGTAAIASQHGNAHAGFVVQPMVTRGVEMIAGVVQDPAFGPLVMVGAGGVTAELLADRAYSVLPLTDRDAADAIRSLRLAPLLFGYRGRPRAAVHKLEDLLLRLARLADDLPEVAELDCNPVIVTPTAALVVDAKVNEGDPVGSSDDGGTSHADVTCLRRDRSLVTRAARCCRRQVAGPGRGPTSQVAGTPTGAAGRGSRPAPPTPRRHLG
jgi:acyl-CoA synthetase (NDP forming)